MKMKNRGEDLEDWYTYYLVHHLPGAPNTDYLALPIVSEEAITFHPKREVTTNKYFFDENILTPCTTTSRVRVAQLVRARDCQSLGRRFDSV